jgi:hypothetical protein
LDETGGTGADFSSVSSAIYFSIISPKLHVSSREVEFHGDRISHPSEEK